MILVLPLMLVVMLLLPTATAVDAAPKGTDEFGQIIDGTERAAGCVDADQDGHCLPEDCDDTNADVYPGALEICDGLNDDCDHPYWPVAIDGWSENVISTDAYFEAVFAADIDGDLHVDVLSANDHPGPRRIVWHENPAGDGSEWTEHVISTTDSVVVFAVDVDGDLGIDVLSASEVDNTVTWYRNTASDGSTWTEHVISSTAAGAQSVFAADLDGDLDIDTLSASFDDDKIAWYENTTGNGSTWTEHVISSTAEGARSVFAADLDGDTDIDVISASGFAKIAWYENTAGDGSTWTEHVISTAAEFISSVSAADIDGDLDIDVLSASKADDKFAWYENTAEDGSAWTEHVISTTPAGSALSVVAVDVDDDLDIDVLSAAWDKIFWHENTAGDGSAWTEHVVPTTGGGPFSVFAADIGADLAREILSAGSRLAWHGAGWLEQDNDGDGLAECEGDCNDGEPGCTTDCTDADQDGVALCAGDCDDTDPDAYPGATEFCSDGADTDCSGLSDAEDRLCPGLTATGLRFTAGGHWTLAWDAAPAADLHALYRGTISSTGLAGYDHLCEATLAGPTAEDSEEPWEGEGFYYLVTGMLVQAGPEPLSMVGSLGVSSNGQSRPGSPISNCGM